MEAVRGIAGTDFSLGSVQVMQALALAIKAELRIGSALGELTRLLPIRWKKFSTARDQGKFEIRGWSAVNFFAGRHWKDEQSWPWKAEFRPGPKMRYVDPAKLYSGPEYQQQAVGA